MLAVIDTNVWISALLSRNGGPARIAELVGTPFTPVFCDATLSELRSVSGRDRLRKNGLTSSRYERLESRLRDSGLVVEDPAVIAVSRDPKDDIFIALAVAAECDYLVSGDDDLKGDDRVREHLAAAGVRIATVRQFVAIVEAQEGEPDGSPSG